MGEAKETKFDIWWNSEKVKRIVGAVYSIGASVVILGAMGKILHTSWGGAMLGTGMSIESLLFFLGVFDKPHRDIEWYKIFAFDDENEDNDLKLKPKSSGQDKTVAQSGGDVSSVLGYTGKVSEADVEKLNEGIKKLTQTAEQISSLSDVVASSGKFASNLDAASDVTTKFTEQQEVLNSSVSQLHVSYKSIVDGIDLAKSNTSQYAERISDINKNLASINSLYEIQLKNIQAQSEGLALHTESVEKISDQLNKLTDDVVKMKNEANVALNQTEKFKSGTEKLAQQVTDLNAIYGNMLNALS